MDVMNWITFLIYLQLLWVVFTIAGLVVGGVFPATFAMFGVIRGSLRDQSDVPVFKTFVQMYKEAFGKANLLGWGAFLVGFSLYFYYAWSRNLTGFVAVVLMMIVIFLAIIYLMTVLFLVPVYVHFDIKILEVIRHATFIAISHPFHLIAMVATFIGFWYLLFYIPGAIVFIGLSLLAYVLMFIANAAFNSMERKINAQKGS